jgi:uncharacterized protein YprB with RNaseH-like and TPR domain
MSELDDKLAALKKRIAKIDRKFSRPAPQRPLTLDSFGLAREPLPASMRVEVDQFLTGEEVENAFGLHFQSEKVYEPQRRHGSVEIRSLGELPADSLGAISNGEIGGVPPEEWAFLDTETTGLAGGSGTYAFLVGVGHITRDGFRVRQFFMRDYSEEASLLEGLAEYLKPFRVLITYNGKSYDQPLLETRYRMARRKPPFASLPHLDLLYGARRLWKQRWESCRLVELEHRVLGFVREGDLPGEMIPYVYFDYLRTKEAFRVVPILHHNVMDIVTLGCLTAIVPLAFQRPEDLLQARHTHGTELLGLARWLLRCDDADRAALFFRTALQRGLADEHAYRALWELGQIEKRQERWPEAEAAFRELSTIANPHQLAALEELAKHAEHTTKDFARALDWAGQAALIADTEAWRKRRDRLERRLARAAGSGRLLE